MGNSNSMDFRRRIVQMRIEDIALDDHAFWKEVFLVANTPDEVAAFVSWGDVRRLRRLQTRNLACLLYKAIEQLESFITSPRSVSDYTSVLNAVRIITQIMPVVQEELVVPEKEPELEKWEKKNPPPPPPPGGKTEFADDFVEHVLWNNMMCQGEEKFLTKGGVPLGERLVNVLVELLHCPMFTIGKLQQATTKKELRYVSDDHTTPRVDNGLSWTTYGHEDFADLNADWYNKVSINFDNTKRRHRVDVLRCLLATLSGPVFAKDVLSPNPFLDILRDAKRCPLGPTLCKSLLGNLVSHFSHGTLPYTSYYGADLPENVLALCLQLLTVVLSPNKGDLIKSNARAYDPSNSWWFVVDRMVRSRTKNQLFQGIQRIIDNPLYTTQTYLSGSQKTVHCHVEALALLFTLTAQHSGFVHIVGVHLKKILFSLLYFVQESKVDNLLFGEVQIIAYVLMTLSSEEDFAGMLEEKVEGKVPLARLRTCPDATFADVLCMSICMVISPSSPRWLIPLFPIFATILFNVSGSIQELSETACFELHHMLEFVTSKPFLRRGEIHQATGSLVVEALCNMMQFRGQACIPLAASLGVSDVAMKLNEMLGMTAEQLEEAEDEATRADNGGKPFKLSKGFRERTPGELLLFFANSAKEKLNEVQAANEKKVDKKQQDSSKMYEALGVAMSNNLPPPAHPLTKRQLTITDEVKGWVSSYLWGIVHHHNTRPPIFDCDAATAFKLK